MSLLQRRTVVIILPLALVGSPAGASDKGRAPTFDDLLTIKSVRSVAISPDGRWMAYTVSHTDFKVDAFIDRIEDFAHVVHQEGEEADPDPARRK